MNEEAKIYLYEQLEEMERMGFGTKEQLTLLMRFGNILVHIDTNQYANLVYIVQEWAQSEIARCSQKTYYCIKMFDLRIVLKDAFKLID